MNRAHLDFQSASEPTSYAVDGRHRLCAIEIAIDQGRVVAVHISWPEFLRDMDDDRLREIAAYVAAEDKRREPLKTMDNATNSKQPEDRRSLNAVVSRHCAHIRMPYTLEEICERVASNEYNAELMLQHLLLEVISLTARLAHREGKIEELQACLREACECYEADAARVDAHIRGPDPLARWRRVAGLDTANDKLRLGGENQ